MKVKNRVGKKYITNVGYEIEIIEYFNAKNSTIKFNDNTLIKNVVFKQIKNRNIKN